MTELNSSLLKSKPNKGLLFVAGLLLVVIALASYTLGRVKEQSRKDVREKLSVATGGVGKFFSKAPVSSMFLRIDNTGK
ncbi:MAG: hypothetical protein V3U07_06770 [Nitrospirales bacterium]